MSTKKRVHLQADQASHSDERVALIEPPARAGKTIDDDARFRSIQLRAYCLWEQAGRPDGDAARVGYWCEAEPEITTAHAS